MELSAKIIYLSIIILNLLSMKHSQVSCYTLTNKESSYLHYKQWDTTQSGTLRFKFKTNNQYGLLMYSDNSGKSSERENFISLKLSYGKVHATIQIGTDDYKSKKMVTIGTPPLNDLNWHTVEIIRDAKHPRSTKIKVDDKWKDIINDGQYDKLDLNSGLYFGGISKNVEKQIIDGSIKIQPRLIGCIDNIEYITGENSTIFTRHHLERSYGASEGCNDACANSHCPNGGRCINDFIKASCECIGTGFSGPTCEEETEVLTFSGKDYIVVEPPDRLKTTSTNHIAFRFKTTQSDGLILSGWSQNDHLMLELHSTIIRLSMDLGGGFHIFVVNNIPFNDGVWHRVEIFRKGRYISLIVDKKFATNHTTDGRFSKFDIRGDQKLYFGGHPNVKSLSEINSKSQKNFEGCLQHIFFNDLDVIYKVMMTRSSQFNLVGTVGQKCTVTKKTRNSRGNKGSNISKSTNQKSGDDIARVKPTLSSNSVESSTRKEGKTLSQDSVTWIAIGLVCGSIVFLITIAFIVYSVRYRYSGVFLSAQAKSKYQKELTSDGAGTLLYTPRAAGKMTIQPHLV